MASRVARYWEQYLDSLPPEDRNSQTYAGECAFGITPEDAREIAGLVRRGRKTATGSLVWATEADGRRLSHPGDCWVVIAGPDDPVAVIETTEVRIIPYDDVPEPYAREGGEGDRTLGAWRRMYWEYIVSECQRIGRPPDRKAPLAMERFRLVYSETPRT